MTVYELIIKQGLYIAYKQLGVGNEDTINNLFGLVNTAEKKALLSDDYHGEALCYRPACYLFLLCGITGLFN